MNVKLTRDVPLDLYSVSPSIPVGTRINVQNMGSAPIHLSTSLAGLTMGPSGDCVQCDPGQVATNEINDPGAFVVSYSANTYINVRARA